MPPRLEHLPGIIDAETPESRDALVAYQEVIQTHVDGTKGIATNEAVLAATERKDEVYAAVGSPDSVHSRVRRTHSSYFRLPLLSRTRTSPRGPTPPSLTPGA